MDDTKNLLPKLKFDWDNYFEKNWEWYRARPQAIEKYLQLCQNAKDNIADLERIIAEAQAEIDESVTSPQIGNDSNAAS